MKLVLLDDVSILENGFMKCYGVNGRKVVIAQSDGKVYAIEDMCGHHGVPLHDGEVKGNVIRCKVHGIKFSLEDGSQQNQFADETDAPKVFSIGYSEDNKQFGVFV